MCFLMCYMFLVVNVFDSDFGEDDLFMMISLVGVHMYMYKWWWKVLMLKSDDEHIHVWSDDDLY